MPPLHMMPNDNMRRPRHRAESFNNNDDDDDDSSFVFRPLVDESQRRLSDVSDCSDCSSACPIAPPADSALRMDRFRALQAQKVAVIVNAGGDVRAALICGSVLKQDGHNVTVFSPSSPSTGGISTRQRYPTDALTEDDILYNTRIIEMATSQKISNGWVVTYEEQWDENLSSNIMIRSEVFDFVVVATQVGNDETFPSYLPEQYQEQLSSQGLYRNMVSPDIPNLAVLVSENDHKVVDDYDHHEDYSYIAAIWLSTLLYKEMTLPSSQEQRRGMAISSNDVSKGIDTMMQDLGLENKNRRGSFGGGFLQRLFGSLASNTKKNTRDYRGTLGLVQQRRRFAEREGWGVQLYPVPYL